MLGALITNAVATHTANEGQKQTSGGADSRKTMRGDLLERLEGLVCVKTLRNVLGTLITDAVEVQTVSERQKQTSAGADSRNTMRSGVLEGLEGLVRLQALRKVLSGLGIEVVVTQTASERRKQTSGGADSRERGVR